MNKIYKTKRYTPHNKYTISLYDENMQLCCVFNNYREVAEFLGVNESSVAGNFIRSKKTNYYGKRYTLERIRNIKEKENGKN